MGLTAASSTLDLVSLSATIKHRRKKCTIVALLHIAHQRLSVKEAR